MRGVCFLACAWVLGAQAPTVFKVETRVVNVTFSAADEDGRPLRDLRREELTLKEDGVRQELRYFSRENDAPLTVGIIVDLSGSQKGLFRKNRRAALEFLRQVLKPQDKVFLVTFGQGMRLVLAETSSLAEVERTFDAWDDAFEDSPLWSRRTGSPVYDSLAQSAKRVLAGRAGRKALLMISDGLDTRSRLSADDVMEQLQTADTVAYWLKTPNMLAAKGAAGLGAALSRMDDNRKMRGMRRIAERTGGRVFEDESLEEQFRQIESELRTLYSVGFAPVRAADGKMHKLELKVERKRVRVRHKPEYRDEPALTE